jgi:hypothetical protein
MICSRWARRVCCTGRLAAVIAQIVGDVARWSDCL